MSYDITFGTKVDCKNKQCDRHPKRLRFWNYPVSIANFEKCKYWKEKNNQEEKKWII